MFSIRRILILLLIASQARAQRDSSLTTVGIYGFNQQLIAGSPITCYVDQNGEQRIENVRNQPFNVPFRNFIDQISQLPHHTIFWLKFDLSNRGNDSIDAHLYYGSLDDVDLYFVSDNRIVATNTGGFLRRRPSAESYVALTTPTTNLRIGPQVSGTVYMKFSQSTQEFDFNGIQIYDQENLYASYASDYESNHYFVTFQLLFQGFLLCQLIYVLFQWIIIRRSEYIFYAAYLFLIALYFLSKYEDVYGIYFIFSRFPLLKVYLNKTLIIFPYYFYFRFVRSFLDMKTNYPQLNKWIVRIEYFLLIYLAFDLIFIITTFNIPLQRQLYTFILSIVFILATSFIVYLFGKKQTLIYYILSGSLFVGIGNITGLILTYLDENEHVNLGFHNMLMFSQVGILLEIFCFTAGLSYKSKAAEEEKISSQQNLIEQLKANEALQTKMQGIRNRIAQDLHDDIGSTLSSISILSNLAIKEKNTGQALEKMHEIKDSSVNLMEKMDDIVWSINPRNDSLENLLSRIKRFATTLFEAKNIDYTITIDKDIVAVKLPMEYRQHIYLILKEAINNLVKYSEASRATIEVSHTDGILRLTVSDNGKGFIMQDFYTGNGLLSMKNRAAAMDAKLLINSKANEGTLVQLVIKIK